VLAIGGPAALDAFEAACRVGPPPATVTAVVRTPAEDDGSSGFGQRETL
jgi:hypothetical protein